MGRRNRQGKRIRRNQRRTGRGGGDDQQRYALSIHPTTGAVSMVPVGRDYLHYLQCHDLVPEEIKTWSEEQIRELAGSVVPGHPATWERALILLAHHQSQLASDLIAELTAEAPPALQQFCELAYSESLAWLGTSYQRGAGEEPSLTPAGMPLPDTGYSN